MFNLHERDSGKPILPKNLSPGEETDENLIGKFQALEERKLPRKVSQRTRKALHTEIAIDNSPRRGGCLLGPLGALFRPRN